MAKEQRYERHEAEERPVKRDVERVHGQREVLDDGCQERAAQRRHTNVQHAAHRIGAANRLSGTKIAHVRAN